MRRVSAALPSSRILVTLILECVPYGVLSIALLLYTALGLVVVLVFVLLLFLIQCKAHV